MFVRSLAALEMTKKKNALQILHSVQDDKVKNLKLQTSNFKPQTSNFKPQTNLKP